MRRKPLSRPFVRDSVQWRCHPGILLCDPARVDEFFNQKALKRDLSRELFNEKNGGIFSEGIAVALFDVQHERSNVTVRSERTKSYLQCKSPKSSRGWILGTKTGKLVLCSMDALLFWEPYEKNESPQRYVRLSIPPGWYEVAINHDTPTEADDRWENEIEFVLTRRRMRPKFTLLATEENSPCQIGTSEAPAKTTAAPDYPTPAFDKSLAMAVLSQLTPAAFEYFVTKLFNYGKEEHGCFTKAGDLGEGVFYEPLYDSYGGSLHSVFILQYLPLNLFKRPRLHGIAGDPTLAARLRKLKKEYNGAAGYIGMVSPELIKATQLRSLAVLVNLSGLSKQDYNEQILPLYGKLVRRIGLYAPITLVGSYDSFLDLNAPTVHELLKDFLTNPNEGLAIQFSHTGSRVANFTTGSRFECGVLPSNFCPYEPIITAVSKRNAGLILEFESLLSKNCPEKKLEDFLVAHAKDVFGERYDRIEPQIWLRFPHLDIAGKERRTDVFMKNSVSGDWDLFEIKRPIPLVRTHRDGPALVAEVAHSITQLKRYAHLLSQKQVKENLKRSGIEYWEPTLNLVIGRRPSIPIEQWRWLLTTHCKDVKLFTFDDLVAEMKVRLGSQLRLIEQL